MPDLSVEVEKVGSVALAVMKGQKANALSEGLVRGLLSALRGAETDSSISVFALMSAGKNFCSGADLEQIRRSAPDPLSSPYYEDFGRIYDLFTAIHMSRIPTIAGVAGAAIGAGVNLALACDLRIVATDVSIRGFMSAGVHPGGGHLRLLSGELSSSAAAAMALFGQSMDAKEAITSGFAWRSVERDQLRSEILAIAACAAEDVQLTRSVTATFRATKTSFLSPEAAVQLERAAQVWSLHRRI
jgi:enoyl-CoA hydratase